MQKAHWRWFASNRAFILLLYIFFLFLYSSLRFFLHRTLFSPLLVVRAIERDARIGTRRERQCACVCVCTG